MANLSPENSMSRPSLLILNSFVFGTKYLNQLRGERNPGRTRRVTLAVLSLQGAIEHFNTNEYSGNSAKLCVFEALLKFTYG